MEIATWKLVLRHPPITVVQKSVFPVIRSSRINTGVYLSSLMRLENTKSLKTTSILTQRTSVLDMISSFSLTTKLQTPDGISTRMEFRSSAASHSALSQPSAMMTVMTFFLKWTRPAKLQNFANADPHSRYP